MNQSIYPTYHSTSRVILGRDFCTELLQWKDQANIAAIIESHDEIKRWENIVPTFFSSKYSIFTVSNLAEFFVTNEYTQIIRLIPGYIIRDTRNIDYLKKKYSLSLERGNTIKCEDIITKLIDFWYTYREHIGGKAEYKREWDIIRFTDILGGYEYIIEYFDTEIDDILKIHLGTWARTRKNSLTIFAKHIPDSLDEKNYNTEVLTSIQQSSDAILCSGFDFWANYEWLKDSLQEHTLFFPELPKDGTSSHKIEKIELASSLELANLMKSSKKAGYFYTKQRRTIENFIEYNSLPHWTIIDVTKNWFESICIWDVPYIADDILSTLFVKQRTKRSIAKHLDLLLDIKCGDYIVHRDHGVWRFHAIIKKEVGGIVREYTEIHYLEWDKLFVPITELHRVSKYIGENDPVLTKLTGKEWERIIDKTNEEIEKIAEELLEIGAKRAVAEWIAFPSFPEEEKKFLEAFPYTHTPDQSEAIRDIFADMETKTPMDRLVSGDVWFGKTEVAMNAIYKAVLSGAQVAFISPLLVLADEHYETLTERMDAFGVRIACLTRMSTKEEEKTILKKLKEWTIDVIIGTHRLLSEDIVFKRLGLLVIDEEHKFGVSHKERFKKMKAHLDILSLSATPIPRSLNLALSGIKKISILATPPQKKKPIKTLVAKWDEALIENAILSELERGWQVIILHNRITTLERIESEIKWILGKRKVKIAVTHGRMNGDIIEERIHGFKRGEYDILLSTTIIENGVNFLRANTILITDAEEFWLAQLHQLRGRVGRKDVEGICYLLYRKWELLWEEKERIITLVNNSHLGAGFEIAMRDMEIRWAGDILGIRQAGKSKEVWLTLYFRMLEEKIEELTSGKVRIPPCKIDLDISYQIPESFFENEIDKISFFRDIESIETQEDLDTVYENFTSGYSHIPPEMENFFLLMRTRILLQKYNIKSLKKIGMHYTCDFHESTKIETLKAFLETCDPKKYFALLSAHKARIDTRYFPSSIDLLRYLRSE